MLHCLRGNGARGVCLLVLVTLLSSLLVVSFKSGPRALAATPWGGEVSNEPITASELLSGAAPKGLTRNDRFAPPEGAREAGQPFIGTLQLDSTPMTMLASDRNGQPNPDGFTMNPVLDKDTTLFPDVSLSFFTSNGHLVPTTQELVRSGTSRSYWDIVVQPGRVWSDPNDPPGWNRAAFPFALTSLLGADDETRNGVATFLYNGSRVSPVRFQVVQQTGAPWYVSDYFTAWGVTHASYRPGAIPDLGQRMLTYEKELGDRLPVKPWSELDETVSSDPLVQAFTTHPDANPDVASAAVVHNGVLYRSDCRTAAGPYPYCDEMRYGIMSVTKAAMLSMVLFRVAQKYGAGFLDEPIAKYLPAARRPGWDDVTFRHLANMSSGHQEAGYYSPEFNCYAEQRTADERTEAALSMFPRTYQPGTEYHYKGEDTYLSGVALDALLKSKEGPEASAWDMLEREVYRPIGIYHAPSVYRIEEDGSRGQPHWQAGYYPTLDDLAKIGLLMKNHGAWDGRQILNREIVDSLLPTTTPPPQDRSPDPRYYLNWGVRKVDSWWVPNHGGWGGSRLAVLPKDLVALQVANNGGPHPPSNVSEWPPSDPCAAIGWSG